MFKFSIELLWGTFLMLFGISILIKAVLGINIPIIKIGLGGLLIYLGMSLIFSFNPALWNSCRSWNTTTNPSKKNCYTVFSGSHTMDLNIFDPLPETMYVKFVLSSAQIRLNPHVPTRVVITNVFSRTTLPNTPFENSSYTYHSEDAEQEPKLTLYVHALLSNVTVHN